ncbi:hypothetical protein ACJMK2_018290 [Sinanodonta woodiana]|uniref:TIR domain-containing protein n=1 Tax=Sinanodonta woodiana TaxID=1069815 RepID=A0ABD3UG82_SINWO
MSPMYLFVTLVILLNSVWLDATSLEKCITEVQIRQDYDQFESNGVPMKSITQYRFLGDQTRSECVMDTTDVIQRYNFTQEVQVGYTIVECRKKPIYVTFTPYYAQKHTNVVGYLRFQNCNTSLDSITHFAMAVSFRVTILRQTLLTGSLDKQLISQYQDLRNLTAIWFENYQNPPPNFADILSFTNMLPEIGEVIFRNMSWETLPEFIQRTFTNLQTLDIPYNRFTVPPSFPWTEQVLTLPQNLSRTVYFQNQYLEAYHLDIPPNIFRRYLNLNFNQIQDLRTYTFRGFLQMLTLKGNRLTHLANSTFNLTGLQHLDLSENQLLRLPRGVFQNMNTLLHLDISYNRLRQLVAGTFDDLVNLKYLYLANNSITDLEKGIFSKLRNLTEIHLEGNLISFIDTNALPIDSVVLNQVDLSQNPLTSVPEFVFWIRSLQLVKLKNTQISFKGFDEMLNYMPIVNLIRTLVHSVSSSEINIQEKGDFLRIIDLSNSKVENMFIASMSDDLRQKFILILQHYKFVLDGNPIRCNCKILPVQTFILGLVANKTIHGDEYYFKEWRCTDPVELNARLLMNVTKEETYCPTNISGCPEDCSCYERSISRNIIVDCRRRNLYELHQLMPKGELELWYSGNAITSLVDREYLAFVVVLDLRENKLNHIDPNAVGRFFHIKHLRLDSNLLDSLPKEVAAIEWVHLTLQNNPYKCDCTTLWMKEWIIQHKSAIYDWDNIKCNNKDSGGLEFVFVPNEEFVCEHSDSPFDSIRNVIIPSVSTSITVCFLLALSIIIYTYRLECKVFMYIYLGLHPFDRDADNSEEEVDALIVHSGMLTDWVMKNIVDILEGQDYNFMICDMARDFVIGFSFQENLTHIVRHSKRMLLLISEDWKTDHETFKVTWNIALEKIKESKSNYGIIISHGIKPKQIKDKTLLRYLTQGRFIDSGNRLFVEKVLYSMPIKTNNNHGRRRKPNAKTLIQRELSIKEDHVENNMVHVFISYSDQDLEFVTKELAPELERSGYRLCLPDRDFIPGASKEENILKAIDVSLRTVFVLSGPHIKDEWSLFTFRSACEKSLREKTNHLIVIVRDDIDLDTMDEEVKYYLKTYVSLHIDDRWFWSKLHNGLPPTSQKSRIGYTSPLSMSQYPAPDVVTKEMKEVLVQSEKRVVTRF